MTLFKHFDNEFFLLENFVDWFPRKFYVQGGKSVSRGGDQLKEEGLGVGVLRESGSASI